MEANNNIKLSTMKSKSGRHRLAFDLKHLDETSAWSNDYFDDSMASMKDLGAHLTPDQRLNVVK